LTETVVVRPNGDYGPNEWQHREVEPPVGEVYTLINEPLGDEPSGGFLQAGKDDDIDEEYFHMDGHRNVRIISRVELFSYGLYETGTEPPLTWSIFGNIYFNGGWLSQKTIQFLDGVYSWVSVEWAGLTGYSSDMIDLAINYIAPYGMGALEYMRVQSSYCEVDILYHNHKNINRHINRGINGMVN